MQIMIAFLLLFSLLTISLAANLTVYKDVDYGYWGAMPNTKPLKVSPDTPWNFSCHLGDYYKMRVTIKNISPSVIRREVMSEAGHDTKMAVRGNYYSELGESYELDGHVSEATTKIYLKLYKSNVVCSSLLLAQGRSDSKEDPLYKYICGKLFVLEVDITNECDDPPPVTSYTTTMKPGVEQPNNNLAIDPDNAHETSPNVLLTYVIPPVIAVCVMIVIVLYILYVKKYRHRNRIRSDQGDEIELNTYATPNEVLYADLSLAHGNSQIPRREENSPYAQIIGVIKPVDENVKRK